MITKSEEGHAKVLADGCSKGVYTATDKASAGVMAITTRVVISVEGIMTTENVVCELETADIVNPSTMSGVKTSG